MCAAKARRMDTGRRCQMKGQRQESEESARIFNKKKQWKQMNNRTVVPSLHVDGFRLDSKSFALDDQKSNEFERSQSPHCNAGKQRASRKSLAVNEWNGKIESFPCKWNGDEIFYN
jgi:hypothetical protein